MPPSKNLNQRIGASGQSVVMNTLKGLKLIRSFQSNITYLILRDTKNLFSATT